MKRPKIVAFSILLIAAAIRLVGINSQLWLDEIWSIRLAQKAASPLGVFTLHHDNNHWLNTLVLYFLGPGRPWWTYHVLPEITGIATVLFGWLIARRRGVPQGIAALLLLSASEFLVEYSSDARGYAPAGFFAVLCAWLLERHLTAPRRWSAALLATSAILGLLSHLTFIVIFAGLIAASLVALRRRRPLLSTMTQTAIWWAVPLAVIATVFIVDDVPHIMRGGGPPTPTDLPAQTAAMALGLPLRGIVAPLCAIVVMLLCAIQIWRLFRAADPLWPLFLAAVFFVPVFFCLPRTTYLHPRYIYVAVPFLLMLVGLELAHWLTAPTLQRCIAIAAIIALCVSNLIAMRHFLRHGRGDYLGALEAMIQETSGPAIIVDTADRHPESTLMVLQYYFQYHRPPRRIGLATLLINQLPNQWPQWILAEQNLGPQIPLNGTTFIRRRTFPTGAITSGIPWTLYESADAQPRVTPTNLKMLSSR